MSFLTVLIYVILSLSIGLVLVGVSLDLIAITTISNYLEKEIFSDFSSRIIFFLIGTILILFCLQYIQTLLRRCRRNKSITFESPEGKVSITLSAIEDMLRKLLEERKEVSHVRPKVFLRKNLIEVVIRGVLTSEVNLVEFTKEIQESVKEKMHILLGEDKQVKVNLEIRKVIVGGKTALADEKEPEIPFRNYE